MLEAAPSPAPTSRSTRKHTNTHVHYYTRRKPQETGYERNGQGRKPNGQGREPRAAHAGDNCIAKSVRQQWQGDNVIPAPQTYPGRILSTAALFCTNTTQSSATFDGGPGLHALAHVKALLVKASMRPKTPSKKSQNVRTCPSLSKWFQTRPNMPESALFAATS